MKPLVSSRKVLITAAVLLVTNVVTGLLTTWVVRAHDYSQDNMNYLLNWGQITANFEDARNQKRPRISPKDKPEDETALYSVHEDNARFLVHYPKFCHRQGMDKDRALTLFCWAVAADSYRLDGRDIQVDPAVWRAFLADGPKNLPLYWDVRGTLTRAGAGQGLIRGEETGHIWAAHKPPLYKIGPLSSPYRPLPGEEKPS